MRKEPDLKIDLADIEAALRRAARNAISGTREQRSGRFLGRSDADRWDDQIARDVEAGKLDKLIDEAKRDYESGHGQDL